MRKLRGTLLGALAMTGMSACSGASAADPVKLECTFSGEGDKAAFCEAFRHQLAASLETPVALVASLSREDRARGGWISASLRSLPPAVISAHVSYAHGDIAAELPDLNVSVSDRALRPEDAAIIAKQVVAQIK